MCDCTDDRSGAKEKSRKVEHEEIKNRNDGSGETGEEDE